MNIGSLWAFVWLLITLPLWIPFLILMGIIEVLWNYFNGRLPFDAF